jgi:hypothetical protein
MAERFQMCNPAGMGVIKMNVSSIRTVATTYLVAVATIVVALVCAYCSLFKPRQFENPGLSAYRAPTGAMVHPLISVELVPEAEGGNGTETVGQSTQAGRAESAMAFSHAQGLQRRYLGRRAKLPRSRKPRFRITGSRNEIFRQVRCGVPPRAGFHRAGRGQQRGVSPASLARFPSGRFCFKGSGEQTFKN